MINHFQFKHNREYEENMKALNKNELPKTHLLSLINQTSKQRTIWMLSEENPYSFEPMEIKNINKKALQNEYYRFLIILKRLR